MRKLLLFALPIILGWSSINAQTTLVITEIMYNGPEAGTDSTEFIEIYNNDVVAVNLTNYSFTGVTYVFPNVTLNPGEFYVIAVKASAFNNVFGFMPDGVFTGGLNNAGEFITIKNSLGNLVDSVNYDDASPWPNGFASGEPDGGGASLILCDVNSDNNDGNNWNSCATQTGVIINGFEVLASPGAANNCCSNTSSTINAPVCSGNSYTYVDGTTVNNVTADVSYVSTIPNLGGCDSVVTENITVLSLPTGNNNTTICAEENLVINGTTYNASNPTGVEVFVAGGFNGCDSIVTVALNVLPALTGNNNTTICAEENLVINGTTYNASNPTGTEVFTNVGANGCDSTVTVALNVLPALVGTDNTTICATGSVVINGTTYDASNSTGTEVFTNVGANGCDSTVTVALNVLAAVDVTVDNSLMPILSANQVGATYQWVDCDNSNTPIFGEINQTFTATANGNYAVEVTFNGCTEVSACETVTGVGFKEATNNVVSIYPNPTNGMVNINFRSNYSIVDYTISSIEGRIIETGRTSTNNITVDLSKEGNGVYFVKITTASASTIYKLIKQ